MRTRWTFGALLVAAMLALPNLMAQESDEAKKEGAEAKKEKVDLSKIKCPLSGRDIDETRTVEYKDSTVYFCCPNCVKAVQKDAKKFASKLNYQLVATKQAKQEKCPFSGQPKAEDTEVKVGYAELEVGFCCPNCQKKAKSADEEKLVALIFDEEAFKKAFVVAKEEEKKAEKEEGEEK